MKYNKLQKIFILIILLNGLQFAQEPGDLFLADSMDFMTAEEIQSELEDEIEEFDLPWNIEYDVSLYRLEYYTTDPWDNLTIASGVLAVPGGVNQNYPIISFQHGTVLKRTSVASENGFDLISMWLGGRGNVTVIPDFLGLGISQIFHPYMVSRPSATAVVDMIRASKYLCDSLNISLSGQLFLAGYSEGGYVTMAAHKYIEEELSSELTVTASAPCAGPYDLSSVMLNLMLTPEPYGQPNYLPYTVLAYNDVYSIYSSPAEFFIAPYDSLLPLLFDGTHSAGEVNAVMPDIPLEIFIPEIVTEILNNEDHPLRLKLEENDVYQWVPQAPMTLFHSNEDELVPVQNALNAYEYFIEHGAENVQIYTEDLGSHVEAAGVLLLAAAAWMEEISSLSSHATIITPKIFTLYQNYPNPFNPSTTLKYNLIEKAHLSLTIYDLLGKEINQLVNSIQNPGNKSIVWEGTDSFGRSVSAGVYLYQVRTEEYSATKKIVLLK